MTRDYVLGLEAVLANGDIVRVGGRTHKNKTGFDFSRFFTGSEGMLAVVTEATLKLLPLPPFRANLAVGFSSMRAGGRGLCRLFLPQAFCPVRWKWPMLSPSRPPTIAPTVRGCGLPRRISSSNWMGRKNRSARNCATSNESFSEQKPLFVERGLGSKRARRSGKSGANFLTPCATPD